MRRAWAVWLLAAALAAPVTASPDDGTITVTGERLARDALRARATAFVQAVSAHPVADQFARWNTPICPKVIGLPDATIAARVVRTVRRIATEAGAPLAREGCADANFTITFTDDGAGVFRTVERQRGWLFVNTPTLEVEALRKPERPVRWWYLAQQSGAKGGRVTTESAALTAGMMMAGNNDSSAMQGAPVLNTFAASVISSSAVVDITHAAVVIDVNRAAGRSLDAVAAYAAMVGLSRIKLEASAPGASSILSLFASAAAPPGLTSWDRAYLAALYATLPDRKAGEQRGRIAAAMLDRLTAASGSDR